VKKCKRCGLQFETDDAKFCPACGGKLVYVIPRLNVKKRMLVFSVSLILSVAVTLIGLMEKIPPSEGISVRNNYRGINEFLEIGGLQYIFGNNVMICLHTFIPLIGPLNGLYVLYRTGWTIAALSASSNLNPLLVFAGLWMRYAHTWLEYCAVSLALSEGFILSYYILRYRLNGLREEAANIPLIFTYCAVILFFAAMLETASIIAGW